MDFKDSILQLAERIKAQKDAVQTEEATKNAFILPLISALGYDVFNPFEVVPELDCDLIKKKGEKIDYAIKRGDETILLIECKHCSQNLNLHDTQLKKYFVASNARFGVLTNGIEYRFYTDLEKQNIMDDKPFMVINMVDLSDDIIEQLKKFHKSYYDVDNILSTAQALKYTTQLRAVLSEEIASPSDEFVRLIAKKIHEGVVNQKILEQFRPLVSKAFDDIINDRISERLGLALKPSVKDELVAEPGKEQEATADKNKKGVDGVVAVSDDGAIITTQEEIDSYLIVKAILREVLDVSRVYYRDAQSYFAILLDDNNRRPICRMYFNAKSVKYIAFINEDKKEEKFIIQSLDDIFSFADKIKSCALRFA